MTTEILELPEMRARLSRVSVADFQRMTELELLDPKTTLIRGLLIDKMSKSPLHQSLCDHLRDLLAPQVPAGFCLRADGPVSLADSVPEPDLAIVCGARGDFVRAHPVTAALVVEVAVTSAGEDRQLAAVYAEAGVSEYWIVLAGESAVEVHRQPEAGKYREQQTVRIPAMIESIAVPGLRIGLNDLFAGL